MNLSYLILGCRLSVLDLQCLDLFLKMLSNDLI